MLEAIKKVLGLNEEGKRLREEAREKERREREERVRQEAKALKEVAKE